MPTFERGDVSLYYEECGAGYPVFLLAPGSLQSGIDWWGNKSAAPYDPREEFAAQFRLIAMDQRNAGQSRAPIRASDGWHSYREDHVALLDHLGIERAHVIGACIGVSFCLRLMQDVPDRITAGVLQQPIGREDDNAEPTTHQVEQLVASLPEDRRPSSQAAASFSANLYSPPFVYSVSRDFVRNNPKPLIVLPGNDKAHPAAIAREIVDLSPNVDVIDNWREKIPEVVTRVRQFLEAHTPS